MDVTRYCQKMGLCEDSLADSPVQRSVTTKFDWCSSQNQGIDKVLDEISRDGGKSFFDKGVN